MHRLLPCLLWLSPTLASLKDLASCDPLRKDMRNGPPPQPTPFLPTSPVLNPPDHHLFYPPKAYSIPTNPSLSLPQADCPPDPAFASQTSFDFSSSSWDDQHFLDFWSVDNSTADDRKRLDFGADGKGLAMGMFKTGDAPTLVSNKYLLFGKVSVTMQAARGPGLITAMVLKSDSGDEIDWELLGAYDNQAQSNYFYDGQALFNTYNDTYALSTSSFDAPQTYAVEWTDQFLSFSVNDTIRKIWYVGEIPADKWPQTPMQVKLGAWSVSNESDRGTIAWAGGVPDWEAAPYKALFTKVDVQDYMGFCNDTERYVEYQYDERTVGWQNVRIAGCKSRPGPDLQTPSPVGSGDATTTQTEEPKTGDENAALAMRSSRVIGGVLGLAWLLLFW